MLVFSWSASNPQTLYSYNVNSWTLIKLSVVLYLVLGKHIGQMLAGLSAVLIGFIVVYLSPSRELLGHYLSYGMSGSLILIGPVSI